MVLGAERKVGGGSCQGIGDCGERVRGVGSQVEEMRMGGYISGGQRSRSRWRVWRLGGVVVVAVVVCAC